MIIRKKIELEETIEIEDEDPNCCSILCPQIRHSIVGASYCSLFNEAIRGKLEHLEPHCSVQHYVRRKICRNKFGDK